MEKHEVHPSLDDLKAFNVGNLPPVKAEIIEVHVLECDTCCETLLQLGEGDTLVSLLKGVDDVEEQVTLDLSQTRVTGSYSEDAAIPEELVEHSRYRVIGLVGRGGMGVVYEAEHLIMQRKVALKVINPDLVQKPAAVERFRREVRAAAQLFHPNIVAAYDAEKVGDTHLLAMEFVAGEELSEVVSQRGALPAKTACDYARQVACGLQHAYEHGMVHRDIKPQNLMVTPDGTIKILDFGLASFVHDTLDVCAIEHNREDEPPPSTSRLTSLGSAMGTPDYIAPEQAANAQAADIRSDIYSLGCTLYYMLSGKAPFAGNSVTQKLEAHMHKVAPPLADLIEDVPEKLSDIVARMMSKDPDDRINTPQEVIEGLAPFADDTPTAASPPQRPPPFVATLLGFAGFAAFVTAVVVWKIQTPIGTVQLRADKAIADDVQVVLTSRGEKASVLKPGDFSIDLEEGIYEVSLSSSDTRAILQQHQVSVKRGATTLVEVTVSETPQPIQRTGEPLLATLKGHEAEVSDLAYAPNHKLLATASYDSTIRLWNVETGEELGTLRGHEGQVRSIDISPDESILASAAEDGKLLFWDIEKKNLVKEFKEGMPEWNRVRFSPDGRILASHSRDNRSVALWDVKTGEIIKSFFLDGREAEVIRFSPDGTSLLVSSKKWKNVPGIEGSTTGGYLQLWHIETGEQSWSVVADPRAVMSVEFFPDGKTLAVGCADHRSYLHSAETGRRLVEFGSHPSWVFGMATSPNGNLVASASDRIAIWDATTKQELANFRGHYSSSVKLLFLDDATLASVGFDRDVKLWDVQAAISEATDASTPESQE